MWTEYHLVISELGCGQSIILLLLEGWGVDRVHSLVIRELGYGQSIILLLLEHWDVDRVSFSCC